MAELVARKAQHRETLVAVLAPQRLETLVLRREAALRSNVDDQQRLAREFAKPPFAAVDVGGVEVVGSGHPARLLAFVYTDTSHMRRNSAWGGLSGH